MRRWLEGVLIVLALAALLGWAGEMDRRDALEANGARSWSVAQWERSEWGAGR